MQRHSQTPPVWFGEDEGGMSLADRAQNCKRGYEDKPKQGGIGFRARALQNWG